MEATEIRQRRRTLKHIAILAVAFILMPLNQGCDIAKVMAAIGQLVQAIAPNTGAAGTTPGATTPGATPPNTGNAGAPGILNGLLGARPPAAVRVP